MMEKYTNMTNRPLVSICIPVFNEEKDIERTITNVLSQTYENFEVVISDNASTDQTEAICRRIAQKDDRLKYFRSLKTSNQNENFNRVFKLSKGQFTLWMGGHDWLDPSYIEHCIAKFEENPEFVLIITNKKYLDDNGVEYYKEYNGTMLNLNTPCKRFSRMLWFLTETYLYLGPVSSIMRRSVLEKTGMLRSVLYADLIFALDMSLLGPWGHIPKCLQFRKNPVFFSAKESINRYGLKQNHQFTRIRMCFKVIRMVWEKDFLGFHEKVYCIIAVFKYYFMFYFKRAFRKFLQITKIRKSLD